MSSNIFISIIIPTYKRNKLLKRCLKRIASQLSETEELIVVDNYKQGYARKVINFSKELNFKYFYEPRIGPSWARNLGFEKAKGKAIVFLDDDCLVQKNWLRQIKIILKKSLSRNLIFQGKFKHFFEERNNLSDFFYWQNKNNWQEIKNTYSWNLDNNYINFINAGNFFCKRSVLSKLNYVFDTKLFPFICEERDLAYRLQLKGIGIVYTPSVLVKHIKDKPTVTKLIRRSFLTGEKEYLLEFKYKVKNKKILDIFENYYWLDEKRHKLKVGIKFLPYFLIKKSCLILGRFWGHIRRFFGFYSNL